MVLWSGDVPLYFGRTDDNDDIIVDCRRLEFWKDSACYLVGYFYFGCGLVCPHASRFLIPEASQNTNLTTNHVKILCPTLYGIITAVILLLIFHHN
jgi:hypothetical protein